jgi:hypothetical protein
MNVNLMAEIKKKKHASERYKQTRNGKECLKYTRARNSTKSAAQKTVKRLRKGDSKEGTAKSQSLSTKLKTRS